SYRCKIDRYLHTYNDSRISLATDSAHAQDFYKKRYGSRLVTTPHVRSYGEALHGSNATPQQGEEAVLDALLLSSCDHLIHGISNLSLGSLVFNGQLSHEDVYDSALGKLGLPT